MTRTTHGALAPAHGHPCRRAASFQTTSGCGGQSRPLRQHARSSRVARRISLPRWSTSRPDDRDAAPLVCFFSTEPQKRSRPILSQKSGSSDSLNVKINGIIAEALPQRASLTQSALTTIPSDWVRGCFFARAKTVIPPLLEQFARAVHHSLQVARRWH